MEDEQRDTQRKKIQILFQLGKWSDVVKLCSTYAEKYGKDMEIDMIRFKSERHLGVASAVPPAEEPKPAPPRPAATEATIVSDPSIPLIPPESQTKPPPAVGEVAFGGSDEPAAEIDMGDPFSGDDLVISDPFAAEEPPVTMAAGPGAPVLIGGAAAPADDAGTSFPKLELEEPGGIPAEPDEEPEPSPPPEEKEPDLSAFGGLTIDAEPDLAPAVPATPRVAPAPEPRPEPQMEAHPRAVGTMYGGATEARPFSPPHSRGHADEEAAPARMTPPTQEGRAEKPQPRPSPYSAAAEAPAPEPGKRLNVKLLLFIILPLLAAAALWLVLSGRLGPSAAEEPSPAAQTANPAPVRRRPAPAKPVGAPPAQAVDAQAAEKEKEFADKLLQAEELEKKGETLKAWALVLEAKKIKLSEPLQQLEERLARRMQEEQAQAQKEKETALSQWELETQALAKAKQADSIAGWQAFLHDYPQSGSAPMAEARIAALEKKAQDAAQQQLLQRIQLEQKVRLRADYASLSPAEAAALLRQGGRPPARFEPHAHGNATVTLDLTAGLMWSLYNRPMAYDKARWWANRIAAGYGGWRLPTTEEALSLLQMDRGQYAGMAGFAVWTGDSVSDQPRTVWVLKLPEGQFAPGKTDDGYYVWAVRKAGR